MMRFLSLGAGVQSSTLALKIAHGELPMVDAAIFADTKWEPKHVYVWLDWLEQQLPFPVHRVSAGDLRANILNSKNTSGGRFAAVPWYMINPDGSRGMGRRQCTSEYKLRPIIKEKRRLLGYLPRKRVKRGSCTTLIGISTDEAMRMKPSTEVWNVNEFPLIDAGMSRNDCLAWMRARGYPEPPKSSCVGCPYHSDHQWKQVMADPIQRADVIEIDEAIREPVRAMKGRQFMHAKRIPIAEIDFTDATDNQPDQFNNECEGICGV